MCHIFRNVQEGFRKTNSSIELELFLCKGHSQFQAKLFFHIFLCQIYQPGIIYGSGIKFYLEGPIFSSKTLYLTLLDPRATKCPDLFHIAIAVFFFSRKRVFLLFDFYFFWVKQFLMKKKLKIFTPTPSEGGTKKTKKMKIGRRA